MAADEREIEVRASSVEEAIEEGLARLGVARNDVIIDVVDEGSSGFLGIGGREAVVRLNVLGQPKLEQRTSPIPEVKPSPATKPTLVDRAPAGDVEAPEADVALEVVKTLVDMMDIDASISVMQTEPDDLTGETRAVIDIRGEDMGVLIGPRGETLNSLQYIARLMAGHQMRTRTSFIVDVEGYRARREQALASLANRMAEKAIRNRRPMTLEPMPPNERRIIHLTLRQDNRVRTESTGEGSRRKVRIYPT